MATTDDGIRIFSRLLQDEELGGRASNDTSADDGGGSSTGPLSNIYIGRTFAVLFIFVTVGLYVTCRVAFFETFPSFGTTVCGSLADDDWEEDDELEKPPEAEDAPGEATTHFTAAATTTGVIAYKTLSSNSRILGVGIFGSLP
jgi:hypothetical protein